MPQKYKRVTTVRYDDQLYEKLKELNQIGMVQRDIAKRTGISRETVRRWLNRAPTRIGSGRKPVLSMAEENQIAAALTYSADLGHPLKREDLKNMVQSYVNSQKLVTPFYGGKPGNDFCRGFEKRHPELGSQVPELVTNSRN